MSLDGTCMFIRRVELWTCFVNSIKNIEVDVKLFMLIVMEI
jgi:hypothetical protein